MIPLKQEHFYHIYNRANGSEKIFLSDENYRFFLEKYQLHLSEYVNTYCYCLMPNHFHLLVSIKSEEEILNVLAREEKTVPKFKTLEQFAREQNPARFEFLEKLVSKQFSNFFSSYSQAFNKQQKRMGSLFMKNFKRKLVKDDEYLKNLVQYIHRNPVDADICDYPHEWKHSSYKSIIQQEKTFLKNEEVLSWFENKENFEYVHRRDLEFEDLLLFNGE